MQPASQSVRAMTCPRCARARAGAAGGHAGRQAAHLGSHTKTESLATDISADAREYEEARAGIMPEAEQEEEEEDTGPEEAPVLDAPPMTVPQGVSSVVAPPELAQ